MARNLVRVPIIPLDYLSKDKSMGRELMLDYDNKKIYAKTKDGLIINFNEYSDDHIHNDDIHTTKVQKDKWTQDIIDLFLEIIRVDKELALKATIDSPTFTGIPKAPSADSITDDTQIATTEFVQAAIRIGDVDKVDGRHVDDTQITTEYLWTAAKVKAYVDTLLSSNDAMIFKGTLGIDGTITDLPTSYDAGWSYKIITAGNYAGNKCEIGDLIICIKDSTTFNNADWSVVQTNIDGAVTSGSLSVTSGHIPMYDGVTGTVLKTSGKTLPEGNLIGDTSYGTSTVGGVVKSSESNNKVKIETDGTMSTNLLDVTKGGTGKTGAVKDTMIYATADNEYGDVVTSDFGRSLLKAISGEVFTNLNADMIDGYHVSPVSVGPEWEFIPRVDLEGTMEIGKDLDFHSTSDDGKDHTYRLSNDKEGELTGSGKFSAPEIGSKSFSMDSKAFMQFNEADETIEFVFA